MHTGQPRKEEVGQGVRPECRVRATRQDLGTRKGRYSAAMVRAAGIFDDARRQENHRLGGQLA